MIAILCLEDHDGMMFHQRRVSKDRYVIDDVMKIVGNQDIYMDEYSAKMFASYGYTTVNILRNSFSDLKDEDFYFFEQEPPADFSKIHQLILYRWNRRYPADTFFGGVPDGYRKIEVTEFTGYSHDNITREGYKRCKEN